MLASGTKACHGRKPHLAVEVTRRPGGPRYRKGKDTNLARYIGPVCRQCRREGMKLFLKGERCHSEKCAIERRNFVPGQTARIARRRLSATAFSYAKSRRCAGCTACWSASSARLTKRPPWLRASQAR